MNNPKEPSADLRALRGRGAVVWGGTSGRGRGAGGAAAEAGAEVIVAGRRPVAARGLDAKHAFQQVLLDVTDEASVRAAFETIGAHDHLFVTAAPPAVVKP